VSRHPIFSTIGLIRLRLGSATACGCFRGELDAVLGRPRYGRRACPTDGTGEAKGALGHRHGSRPRWLTGTFGKIEIKVPRARLEGPDGGTSEWKSQALRAYQRRTLAADALIAAPLCPAPTRVGSAVRLPPSLAGRSARTQ
jgi:hypothetical protein